MQGSQMPVRGIEICHWADQPDRQQLVHGIDRIMHAAAGARTFADSAEQAAFRWRWLGQYLELDPTHVHLALAPARQVAGYLVGCYDDPASSPRFADLSYFERLAPLTARFPAHLHVNLHAAWRNAGVGSRLVAAFAAAAAAAGVPGMHVVTGKGARNIGFYNRNGFTERSAIIWNGRDIVFLGREITPEA